MFRQRIIFLLELSLIFSGLIFIELNTDCAEKEASSEKVLKNAKIISFSIPESCHTQGMALDENYLYLSCCELIRKKGFIYRVKRDEIEKGVSNTELKYERIELTIGEQYHPSGMDINGEFLWVALAEYHPAPARSTFICIDRDRFREIKEKRFELNDHIGALSATRNWIIALNWNARDFYILDYSGKILTRGKNPGKVAYQDCKNNNDHSIICSGTISSILPKGYIDVIEIPDIKPSSWKLRKRTIAYRAEGKIIPLTREAMAIEDKKIYFIPTDFPELWLYRFDLQN